MQLDKEFLCIILYKIKIIILYILKPNDKQLADLSKSYIYLWNIIT